MNCQRIILSEEKIIPKGYILETINVTKMENILVVPKG
jgi:hypothetical protein